MSDPSPSPADRSIRECPDPGVHPLGRYRSVPPAAPDAANRSVAPTSGVQSFAGGYAENADPYAMSMINDSSADDEPRRRGGSYYAMLGVGALALFAISMFVTILLLR